MISILLSNKLTAGVQQLVQQPQRELLVKLLLRLPCCALVEPLEIFAWQLATMYDFSPCE
jgi:hypothetical protein